MNAVVSVVVVGLGFLLTSTPFVYASGRDSAGRKPYACNPRQECMARAAGLKGAAAEAAKRDCSRMPTTGTCFGTPADAPGDRSERGRKK